jgi:hypothetical protein
MGGRKEAREMKETPRVRMASLMREGGGGGGVGDPSDDTMYIWKTTGKEK